MGELRAADLDVRRDGVEVVVVAVVGVGVRVAARLGTEEEVGAEAADAEDGEDRCGEGGAVVGVVAGVGVGGVGDQEGVARARGCNWGGYEDGQGGGGDEDEQEEAVGHGGDGVAQQQEVVGVLISGKGTKEGGDLFLAKIGRTQGDPSNDNFGKVDGDNI